LLPYLVLGGESSERRGTGEFQRERDREKTENREKGQNTKKFFRYGESHPGLVRSRLFLLSTGNYLCVFFLALPHSPSDPAVPGEPQTGTPDAVRLGAGRYTCI
jgi:hypothetical protein